MPSRAADNPNFLTVGAGHNGSTASCYLAREGLRVTVCMGGLGRGDGMTSTNAVLEQAPEHRINEGAGKYLDGLDEFANARRFRAPDGTVHHIDPFATRFGPLRPVAGFAGYRSPLDGLFLSGASTHPSAGIGGVPGQRAAQSVPRSLRRGGRRG